MRITHQNCEKLRAGQTVWRSLIWFEPDGTPYVKTTEILLQGYKGKYSFVDGTITLVVGYDFLHDIACGLYVTTSRRASKRFEKEVSEGMHKNLVEKLCRTLPKNLYI
jgi:hypothetical protein